MATATELAQRLFDAFGKGDMATVQELLADDLYFELGGRSRFAGRTSGRDNVLAMFGDLMQSTAMSNEVIGIYAADDGAIVHQKGSGRDGYTDESLLYLSTAGDRISSIREFLFDTAAFDDLVG